jgi:hypothetical protein
MGYFTYKAEKASGGLILYFLKIALALCFLIWPLAIGEHKSGHPSVLGWILEVPWLLIVGVVAVAASTSKSQAKGKRHR